jgi:hypothetical protein
MSGEIINGEQQRLENVDNAMVAQRIRSNWRYCLCISNWIYYRLEYTRQRARVYRGNIYTTFDGNTRSRARQERRALAVPSTYYTRIITELSKRTRRGDDGVDAYSVL